MIQMLILDCFGFSKPRNDNKGGTRFTPNPPTLSPYTHQTVVYSRKFFVTRNPHNTVMLNSFQHLILFSSFVMPNSFQHLILFSSFVMPNSFQHLFFLSHRTHTKLSCISDNFLPHRTHTKLSC